MTRLSLACNCLARLPSLGPCEALAHLDLAANFLPAARLRPAVAALAAAPALTELWLAGNPCMAWEG